MKKDSAIKPTLSFVLYPMAIRDHYCGYNNKVNHRSPHINLMILCKIEKESKLGKRFLYLN